MRLYQITCHVKPYPLCPSPVTHDRDGYKLKVALYIGELHFSGSAFVSVLSRTPTLMICVKVLKQNPVFSLVSSFSGEVEVIKINYRLGMFVRCSDFLSERDP